MNMVATEENLLNLKTRVWGRDVIDIKTRDWISKIQNMENDVIEKELRRLQTIIIGQEDNNTLFD
jgi:hypothetical protein